LTRAEQMQGHTVRFHMRTPDWNAFPDSSREGYRRAQYRMIGRGGSQKNDPGAIPAEHFTLSIMYVGPGQGGPAHTHEVEEAFFMLQGHCIFFWVDEEGGRHEERLGPWDCVCYPADVPHGFHNDSPEGCYMQVMIGTGQPGRIGYQDKALQALG